MESLPIPNFSHPTSTSKLTLPSQQRDNITYSIVGFNDVPILDFVWYFRWKVSRHDLAFRKTVSCMRKFFFQWTTIIMRSISTNHFEQFYSTTSWNVELFQVFSSDVCKSLEECEARVLRGPLCNQHWVRPTHTVCFKGSSDNAHTSHTNINPIHRTLFTQRRIVPIRKIRS